MSVGMVTPVTSVDSTVERAHDWARIFKLLSDETRLRVLMYLREHGELNVRTLCELLSQSQPAVSHHLALLRLAGLLTCRRDGKHHFYRLQVDRLTDWLDGLTAGQVAAPVHWLESPRMTQSLELRVS
jgi:ArsR family transcriptional regulator